MSMLNRDHPFFYNKKNEDKWHAAVLLRGVKAVEKVDKKRLLKNDYKQKWAHITPTNTFESWKE